MTLNFWPWVTLGDLKTTFSSNFRQKASFSSVTWLLFVMFGIRPKMTSRVPRDLGRCGQNKKNGQENFSAYFFKNRFRMWFFPKIRLNFWNKNWKNVLFLFFAISCLVKYLAFLKYPSSYIMFTGFEFRESFKNW